MRRDRSRRAQRGAGGVGALGALILTAALAGASGPGATPEGASDNPLEKAAFPHATHVEENGMACSACHGGSVRPEEEAAPLPSPGICADCHEPSDVARYFPAGSWHGRDFLHAHALEARTGSESCTVCHQGSESCAMCHHGENLDLLSHPRNWLFLHPIESRNGRMDCAACHASEQFCSSCHADEGVMPGSHRLGGWAGGYIHGAEARRDPEYCAACHAGREPVCTECHSLDQR